MFRKIKYHPLIDLLVNLRGNARVCVYIEPLWGIPMNLIAPFATIYMYNLGVKDIQIGFILSIAMMVQLFFSFFGGIFADKLGRKTTTMLGDVLGWCVPCLVWAVAQNFWFFLIAMVLNSFEQINQTSWSCLLIEDAEQSKVVGIYTWITIAGLLAVFFAPISGILMSNFSLIPVMRTLYFIFATGMLIKTFITYKYTTETGQGKIRKEETKNTSMLKMLGEYKGLVPEIVKNKKTMQTLIIMVLLYICMMISGNFFGLYAGETLQIPRSFLAYFPILRAVIMLVFMFGVQHRIKSLKIPMSVGLLMFVSAQLLLIFSVKGQVFTLVIYTMLEAMAHALVMPRKDALVVESVDPQERARIVAMMTGIVIAVAMPFGYITGTLSDIDRRLPFALSTALFLLAILVVSRVKEEKKHGKVEA